MTIQIHKLAVQRLARVLLGVTVAGALAVLSGCATAPPPPKLPLLAWPEPPDMARIQFVRSIVSDDDLKKDSTDHEAILHFLEGEVPAKNRIVMPMGLAVSDDADRLYVSDNVQSAIFVYDFAKKTSLKIGGDKSLSSPMQLALDAQENIYVVEQEKKGVAVFDRKGKQLNFFTDPSIVRPTGIAIDRARGKVYVCDTAHAKSWDHDVKVFNLQGKFLGKVGLGKGNVDGAMLYPTFLTVDSKGDLYVSDTLNARIQVFDPNGKFVRKFGSRGTDFGQFDNPKGVALDSFGNAYVVDSGWSNVQIFNTEGKILLFFGGRGTYPGLMQNPTVIAIDKNNRIYVGDNLNHRVNVYQLVNTTAADSHPKDAAAAKKADASAKKDDAAAKKDDAPAKKSPAK